MENSTYVKEFYLMGFAHLLGYESLLFVGFFIIYLITVMGNATIFTLILVNSQLHTPMYFFLGNLSFMDICYASSTTPHILHNLLKDSKVISFEACMAQLFFVVLFAGGECLLLAVMAYDRYVAICAPLRYFSIMSRRVCLLLAACPWVISVLDAVLHTALTSSLPFCGSQTIRHIFCDIPQLLVISCGDTSLNDTVVQIVTVFLSFGPFVLIVISYVCIISSILKIQSADGRRKAFSTCGSHLTVVTLYYGIGHLNYNRPKGGYSVQLETLPSILFCIVIPMLNPILYSLRNKEVSVALSRTVKCLRCHPV